MKLNDIRSAINQGVASCKHDEGFFLFITATDDVPVVVVALKPQEGIWQSSEHFDTMSFNILAFSARNHDSEMLNVFPSRPFLLSVMDEIEEKAPPTDSIKTK